MLSNHSKSSNVKLTLIISLLLEYNQNIYLAKMKLKNCHFSVLHEQGNELSSSKKKKAILFYLLKIHHSIKKEKGKHSHFAEDMED